MTLTALSTLYRHRKRLLAPIAMLQAPHKRSTTLNNKSDCVAVNGNICGSTAAITCRFKTFTNLHHTPLANCNRTGAKSQLMALRLMLYFAF